MLFKRPQLNSTDIQKFADLIQQAHYIYAITGAGISTNAGIPDLQHLAGRTSISLSSETSLERDPQAFYRGFHDLFIDPIFTNGPTLAHQALAKLEKVNKLSGIVTTNVDYLHELAGSQHVADIWHSLNINYCIKCGRTYDIQILKENVPICLQCGGVISPGLVYHHIGIDRAAYEKANHWMTSADLVIVIGSNGYYSNVNSSATVININKKENDFDQLADLNIRGDADQVMDKTISIIGI